MSYGAEISFKTIEAEDIPEFFLKMKKACKEHIKDISKDSSYRIFDEAKIDYKTGFSNIYRDNYPLYLAMEGQFRSFFSFRWFYLKEHKLLGVYSVFNEIQYLFDNSTYFQNSCDQDYDFDEWAGVPCFESIVKKWESVSDEEIASRYGLNEEDCIDYFRKSAIYNEIWDMIEDTLEDEDKVTHVSMFGFYDVTEKIAYEKTLWDCYVEDCKYWEMVKSENNH